MQGVLELPVAQSPRDHLAKKHRETRTLGVCEQGVETNVARSVYSVLREESLFLCGISAYIVSLERTENG